MSATTFVPTELVGEHYRPIGGSYESMQRAIDAVGLHFDNTHGGGGSFRVYRPEDATSPAIIEAASGHGDTMAIRALYKVIERS